MIHRQTNLTMSGLKIHSSQRGIGQWWMVLTIGLMVGFIFGFILFLSRLPNDSYTLVETERGIEQIESADADNYVFYDRLSDSDSLVPNAAADDMPAFNRSNNVGKYGAGVNERPSAVQVAEELTVGPDVAPVEIAAVSTSTAVATGTLRSPNAVTERTTVVKRVEGSASTFYYLQAGAFASAVDANRRQSKLVQSGMDAFINNVVIEGKRLHRVRIGPFYNANSLNSAKTKLGQQSINYLVVKVQKG